MKGIFWRLISIKASFRRTKNTAIHQSDNNACILNISNNYKKITKPYLLAADTEAM